ncbi:L,D-transpeptidase [Nocardia huaxiensis]|uniref:L,D-transpeptidase family protein n=1 Tax=Nocardia huaxiensis TaxID=2755382 RepID=A0A7D6ZF76_9NOCA|nr:Ig-like domain-containing protein [Nocardia huaxiensis]QLY29539.1 L,D-transpeptidase family protein [Nocardia huaxiensis]UFS96900.1 Ig-like domain-containing protein [Nocardia huaxiensis]
MPPRRFRSRVATGSTLALILIASACSSEPPPAATPSRSAPAPAVLTMSPAPGAQDVNPAAPVSVTTSSGVLTAVTLTNDEGRVIEGTLSPDKATWRPNEPLGYGRGYTLTAQGLSVTGPTGPVTSTFGTLTPANQTRVTLTTTDGQPLAEGATYGVGAVVVAHFDEDVPNRAEAEKRLVVTTDPPVQGVWYWMDNRNAHWRPREYHKPGTRITVAADVYGAELGPGLFGQENARTSFVIGPSHVSIADDNTHQIEVFENGNLVRTMPTSMGMGGSTTVGGRTISFWTQPGVYTVLGKANPVIMDSSTYGLPVKSSLGYKETIGWATRISTDGIYLHALDSTVWAQGYTDVSHGCLNLSTENASWFFEFSQLGDVVEVRNTGGDPLEVWQNGDWGVPWELWLAGSALHAPAPPAPAAPAPVAVAPAR